jgi:hypothetical protein
MSTGIVVVIVVAVMVVAVLVIGMMAVIRRCPDQWARIQERFIDAPADAVSVSQLLVAGVMTECGYPTEHQDQVLAGLSVGHPRRPRGCTARIGGGRTRADCR